MVVDAHTHLFSRRWYPDAFTRHLVRANVPAEAGDGGNRRSEVEAERFLRRIEDPDGSRAARARAVLRQSARIIAVVDWGLPLGEAEVPIAQVNEEVLTACERHEGLYVLPGIDPRRNGAVALIDGLLDHGRARGIKLHTGAGFRINDDACRPLLELAAGRGIPVLVHSGGTVEGLLTPCEEEAAAWGQALAEHPATIFIAGHAFQPWTREVIDRIGDFRNLHVDCSGWQDWAYSDADRFRSMIAYLLEALGPERVLFGSDAPFYGYNMPMLEAKWLKRFRPGDGETPPPVLPNAGDTESVLSGNAERLFGLEGTDG
jgi:predicted TIM-barrel fold metal-dependent hydrolase